MELNNSTLAERLKELRTEQGWKVVDLAEKTGIDRNMISYYEKGKYLPSADALLKLAEIFNVSIDYLLVKDSLKKPLNQHIDPEFSVLFEDIANLDEKDKEMIKHMIKSLIAKNKVKDLISTAS
jgi:transcriptional regulator with XRE-family HTH domain